MKSIVVKEVVTQLNDDGTELELSTSQYKRNCENIIKKEILMTTCKVDIDKDTFISAMGGTLSRERYIFRYKNGNNTGWSLDDVGTVNLADYGIILDGILNKGDMIYVYCDTVNNVVTNWEFTQTQNEIYIGGANEECNYININSQIPNMTFNVLSGDYGVSVFGGVKVKSENFVANYPKLKITASCTGYYEPMVVTIILAKVV